MAAPSSSDQAMEEAAAAAAAAVEEKSNKENKSSAAGEEEEEVVVTVDSSHRDVAAAPAAATSHVSRLQAQNPVAPIQVAPHGSSTPFQTPPPQLQDQTVSTLNSRKYTNRLSLLLFLLHLSAASLGVGFFVFKAVQGLVRSGTRATRREQRLLHYWLPPIEASAVLSMLLAFAWQKAVRVWPGFMIRFILWSTFSTTMCAGVLLLCFSLPSTAGIGIALVAFSFGTGLYSCWVTRRAKFTARVFARALHPVDKFRGLNGPAYVMMLAGFVWISACCFAVIGAQNFGYPGLTVFGLVLSLAWTAEVMRNVANLTVSRVIALYYLRGMQCSVRFSFQRAVSINLGSASLGSLFVPTIEACRILARGLNLLEGEDEFMFSCAHCCLHVMESVFHYGNSWAFVHIAAYGKGFVAASKSTWGLFQRQNMEELVDSDMTSSVCFLSGVSSGAICVIFAASWTFATHKHYTATVSLFAFFVGYLMTRIGMALPHACIGCYYVCYAENPSIRLFDSTIPDQLTLMQTGRSVRVPTPRFPRRNAAT
ncbi:putative CTL-like protein [Iris pallida]|uniref:Choline transporter-like protein n=1 Tax=Iris pallida TaxID=29817 RepID=A0AAX6DW73_IRIPA|nr:putative CTL-like protein [Iris pallida]KAJ6825609.1 putative CTL-like protein [Iris pallida]